MALPQLTDEQRAAALEKAAAARRARAELKDRLKRGGTNLKQVLTDAETDEVLGKMKISALRDKAKRELGPKFDLRAYNDAVLETGSVPLEALERHIDAWIEARKSAN